MINYDLPFLQYPQQYWERNILFSLVPILGAQAEAPALTTTSLGHAPETCASTSTIAIGAVGLTPGVTAPLFPNTRSKRVIETKIRMKGTLNPLPPVDTRKEHLVPLPTTININKLDEVLRKYPDSVFVAKLCSYLRKGVDIGYNGPRIVRF